MISVEEAKLIIEKYVIELGVESIPLSECGNRILSQDIIATFPSPQFDNSAMDGFALKSTDIKNASLDNPIQLKIIGVSSAGNPSKLIINSGECIQCMTGAKIPKGADTIVMVEDSSGFSELEFVQIFNNMRTDKHIRKLGEEISKGEVLITKGTRITPNEIGVCATFGYSEVKVSKKPQIAIFGTGDELIEPGEELSDGKIYNSNLFVLKELAHNLGADIIYKKVIKDDKSALKLFLLNAINSCDIVVSSGGVSMGKFDYVRDIYKELNVKEHFWKVAQKPGKPLFFGSTHQTLIFGLPGNPVSSFICFVQYVQPVIQKMLNENIMKKLMATLENDFPVEKKKHRYLFGYSWVNSNGELKCSITKKVGSHMLTSSLGANCIIESPQSEIKKKVGDKIIINLLNWRNINDYN